jgi:hypothetical protein
VFLVVHPAVPAEPPKVSDPVERNTVGVHVVVEPAPEGIDVQSASATLSRKIETTNQSKSSEPLLKPSF